MSAAQVFVVLTRQIVEFQNPVKNALTDLGEDMRIVSKYIVTKRGKPTIARSVWSVDYVRGIMKYFSSPQRQTGSGAHSASHRLGTGNSFLWGLSSRGVKLTTHIHLVPSSRMAKLHLHSPYVFMAQCLSAGTISPFTWSSCIRCLHLMFASSVRYYTSICFSSPIGTFPWYKRRHTFEISRRNVLGQPGILCSLAICL
jgi:hypothetical protein